MVVSITDPPIAPRSKGEWQGPAPWELQNSVELQMRDVEGVDSCTPQIPAILGRPQTWIVKQPFET